MLVVLGGGCGDAGSGGVFGGNDNGCGGDCCVGVGGFWWFGGSGDDGFGMDFSSAKLSQE